MITLINLNTIYCDRPEPWQIGFQDGASPAFEGIMELHNDIFFYLVVVIVGVAWVIGSIMLHFSSRKRGIVYKYANHGTLIELVWTITPALILIRIRFPSFKLLYLMDEVISPSMTIKRVGHQWYWSYEYNLSIGLSLYNIFENEKTLLNTIEFDSLMDTETTYNRLLQVDKRVVIPVHCNIKVNITSLDVIHSWAIPQLGVKYDAIPGRLISFILCSNVEGIFYGQCSELCGVNHAFMPIVIQCVDAEIFSDWMLLALDINPSETILNKLYYVPYHYLDHIHDLDKYIDSIDYSPKFTYIY
jgi:cytochrome c oxidase subunit 2